MATLEKARHWWIGDPSVVPCEFCGCPLQARRGLISEAVRAHNATVHPELLSGAS
jgi:hypothetical protein